MAEKCLPVLYRITIQDNDMALYGQKHQYLLLINKISIRLD